MKIGCVLLAAGVSQRFGTINKLLVDFVGDPIVVRTAQAIQKAEFCVVVAVVSDDAVDAVLSECGLRTVRNPRPEDGISGSIKIGLNELCNCDAVMFAVADQPLLSSESIKGAVDLYKLHPGNIISLAYDGNRGNPVIFPRCFYSELYALSGDSGGSAVIKRHTESLLLYDVSDPIELADTDTAKELQNLIDHVNRRQK